MIDFSLTSYVMRTAVGGPPAVPIEFQPVTTDGAVPSLFLLSRPGVDRYNDTIYIYKYIDI